MYLVVIATAPEYQGQGLGSKALLALTRVADRQQVRPSTANTIYTWRIPLERGANSILCLDEVKFDVSPTFPCLYCPYIACTWLSYEFMISWINMAMTVYRVPEEYQQGRQAA